MPERMKKGPWRSVVGGVIVLLAVPLTVVLGSLLPRRYYLVVNVAIVIASMVPFFVSFERRRPRAREIVTLAVMVALAVASRVVFAFMPQFKPMAALIMITGIAFGASSGFLAGSLAAFASNFIFGQGPWTPWQMLAFGLAGYAFGSFADRGLVPRSHWTMRSRVLVSIGGYLLIQLVIGPIVDTSSLFWMVGAITPESVLAVYAAGVPFNAVHGAATFITLFLAGNPLLDKLTRLKTKYGMMEGT